MLSESLNLRAGMLSVCLEPDGSLRHIKWGGREVLMRIYAAVRDRDWGTVPGAITNLKIETSDHAFTVTFRSIHALGIINFHWDALIRGDSDGGLSYTMSGVADSDFFANRIGICILHFMDCAGHPCTITHSDGTKVRGAFPTVISPNQPFIDIAAICHEVSEDLWADVSFTGDVFEMEDQRNWTDASFKTYCTPLSRPFPVCVKSGDLIQQSVGVAIRGELHGGNALEDSELVITLSKEDSQPLPFIGLELDPDQPDIDLGQLEKLRDLRPAHIRVDVDLSSPDYFGVLKKAQRIASKLSTVIEVALFLTDDYDRELSELALGLTNGAKSIKSWLIFSRSSPVTEMKFFLKAEQYLSAITPDARFGAGTDDYFAELNRGRRLLPLADMLVFSINPQVHAFDDESLMETLAAQKVASFMAKSFMPGTPLAVSPVTLKPRRNPNRTSAGITTRDMDARQSHDFAAAWTLGSLKYLAEAGVSSITLFELTGPRGVLDADGTFPVYDVIKAVQDFAPCMVYKADSSNPMYIVALWLANGSRNRLILANVTSRDQRANVAASHVPPEVAFSGPTLKPYAVAIIDWTEGDRPL